MTDILEIAKKLATEVDDADSAATSNNPGWCDEVTTTQEVIQYTTALQVQEYFNQEGLKMKKMKATPTAFIHNLLHLNGQKFDFAGREYLLPIYNAGHQRVLLKTARQVEKSTLLANSLVVNSCVTPFFKSLYVSPSHTQTRQFSNEKLKSLIEQSPIIAKFLINHTVSSQVFEKGFANGSMIFLRSAFLTADRARGISADCCCYDKDAYALTKAGWVKVSEITYEDELADVNEATGKIEWHKPTLLVKKPFTGSMITFTHPGFHMRVTDDHQIRLNWKVKASPKYNQKDEWVTIPASEAYETSRMGFKISCEANWSKHPPTFKSFPCRRVVQRVSNQYGTYGTRVNVYPGLQIPYSKFASIVGWYLAEGHIHNKATYPNPALTLNKEKDLAVVEDILEDSGVTYSIDPHSSTDACVRLVINSQHLGEYFLPLGGSHDKYIPREFFDYPEAIEQLLKGLYLGDACYQKHWKWSDGTLRTRSKRLAEDVQEAWLRLNRPAVIHTRMMACRHPNHPLYDPDDKTPLYEVQAYNDDYMIFWRSQRDKRLSKEYVVNEEVYCFTIPNHRPIIKGNFKSKPVIMTQCIDELQDMLINNVPVILECLSHSKYKFQKFAGTPKTFENTIEQYWEKSTQGEWMIPCDCQGGHAGRFWNFLDSKNISKKLGVVCKRCNKRLDITKGQWVVANSASPLVGYRIPQLMVPWIINTPRDWEVLIHKFETYPEAQFNNEVLGLSYDHASKPISQVELQACCTQKHMWVSPFSAEAAEDAKRYMLFAGVDWGEGRDGGLTPSGKLAVASYTILTIAGYVGKKFHTFYVKKYTGKEIDPEHIVREITNIAQTLRLRAVGVDYGHGWGVNNALIRMLTLKRVMLFQHVPNMRERRKWDERGTKFELNRNLIMSELFLRMKAQLTTFPPWEEYKAFAKDIMSIYAEYCEYQRTIKFDHKPSEPDDCFHSLLYAWQAANIFLGLSD